MANGFSQYVIKVNVQGLEEARKGLDALSSSAKTGGIDTPLSRATANAESLNNKLSGVSRGFDASANSAKQFEKDVARLSQGIDELGERSVRFSQVWAASQVSGYGQAALQFGQMASKMYEELDNSRTQLKVLFQDMSPIDGTTDAIARADASAQRFTETIKGLRNEFKSLGTTQLTQAFTTPAGIGFNQDQAAQVVRAGSNLAFASGEGGKAAETVDAIAQLAKAYANSERVSGSSNGRIGSNFTPEFDTVRTTDAISSVILKLSQEIKALTPDVAKGYATLAPTYMNAGIGPGQLAALVARGSDSGLSMSQVTLDLRNLYNQLTKSNPNSIAYKEAQSLGVRLGEDALKQREESSPGMGFINMLSDLVEKSKSSGDPEILTRIIGTAVSKQVLGAITNGGAGVSGLIKSAEEYNKAEQNPTDEVKRKAAFAQDQEAAKIEAARQKAIDAMLDLGQKVLIGAGKAIEMIEVYLKPWRDFFGMLPKPLQDMVNSGTTAAVFLVGLASVLAILVSKAFTLGMVFQELAADVKKANAEQRQATANQQKLQQLEQERITQLERERNARKTANKYKDEAEAAQNRAAAAKKKGDDEPDSGLARGLPPAPNTPGGPGAALRTQATKEVADAEARVQIRDEQSRRVVAKAAQDLATKEADLARANREASRASQAKVQAENVLSSVQRQVSLKEVEQSINQSAPDSELKSKRSVRIAAELEELNADLAQHNANVSEAKARFDQADAQVRLAETQAKESRANVANLEVQTRGALLAAQEAVAQAKIVAAKLIKDAELIEAEAERKQAIRDANSRTDEDNLSADAQRRAQEKGQFLGVRAQERVTADMARKALPINAESLDWRKGFATSVAPLITSELQRALPSGREINPWDDDRAYLEIEAARKQARDERLEMQRREMDKVNPLKPQGLLSGREAPRMKELMPGVDEFNGYARDLLISKRDFNNLIGTLSVAAKNGGVVTRDQLNMAQRLIDSQGTKLSGVSNEDVTKLALRTEKLLKTYAREFDLLRAKITQMGPSEGDNAKVDKLRKSLTALDKAVWTLGKTSLDLTGEGADVAQASVTRLYERKLDVTRKGMAAIRAQYIRKEEFEELPSIAPGDTQAQLKASLRPAEDRIRELKRAYKQLQNAGEDIYTVAGGAKTVFMGAAEKTIEAGRAFRRLAEATAVMGEQSFAAAQNGSRSTANLLAFAGAFWDSTVNYVGKAGRVAGELKEAERTAYKALRGAPDAPQGLQVRQISAPGEEGDKYVKKRLKELDKWQWEADMSTRQGKGSADAYAAIVQGVQRKYGLLEATLDGKPAGYLAYNPDDRNKSTDVEYLGSHIQGQGVGKALVDELKRVAIALGHGLTVRTAENDAVPFYEKQGFTIRNAGSRDSEMVMPRVIAPSGGFKSLTPAQEDIVNRPRIEAIAQTTQIFARSVVEIMGREYGREIDALKRTLPIVAQGTLGMALGASTGYNPGEIYSDLAIIQKGLRGLGAQVKSPETLLVMKAGKDGSVLIGNSMRLAAQEIRSGSTQLGQAYASGVAKMLAPGIRRLSEAAQNTINPSTGQTYTNAGEYVGARLEATVASAKATLLGYANTVYNAMEGNRRAVAEFDAAVGKLLLGYADTVLQESQQFRAAWQATDGPTVTGRILQELKQIQAELRKIEQLRTAVGDANANSAFNNMYPLGWDSRLPGSRPKLPPADMGYIDAEFTEDAPQRLLPPDSRKFTSKRNYQPPAEGTSYTQEATLMGGELAVRQSEALVRAKAGALALRQTSVLIYAASLEGENAILGLGKRLKSAVEVMGQGLSSAWGKLNNSAFMQQAGNNSMIYSQASQGGGRGIAGAARGLASFGVGAGVDGAAFWTLGQVSALGTAIATSVFSQGQAMASGGKEGDESLGIALKGGLLGPAIGVLGALNPFAGVVGDVAAAKARLDGPGEFISTKKAREDFERTSAIKTPEVLKALGTIKSTEKLDENTTAILLNTKALIEKAQKEGKSNPALDGTLKRINSTLGGDGSENDIIAVGKRATAKNEYGKANLRLSKLQDTEATLVSEQDLNGETPETRKAINANLKEQQNTVAEMKRLAQAAKLSDEDQYKANLALLSARKRYQEAVNRDLIVSASDRAKNVEDIEKLHQARVNRLFEAGKNQRESLVKDGKMTELAAAKEQNAAEITLATNAYESDKKILQAQLALEQTVLATKVRVSSTGIKEVKKDTQEYKEQQAKVSAISEQLIALEGKKAQAIEESNRRAKAARLSAVNSQIELDSLNNKLTENQIRSQKKAALDTYGDKDLKTQVQKAQIDKEQRQADQEAALFKLEQQKRLLSEGDYQAQVLAIKESYATKTLASDKDMYSAQQELLKANLSDQLAYYENFLAAAQASRKEADLKTQLQSGTFDNQEQALGAYERVLGKADALSDPSKRTQAYKAVQQQLKAIGIDLDVLGNTEEQRANRLLKIEYAKLEIQQKQLELKKEQNKAETDIAKLEAVIAGKSAQAKLESGTLSLNDTIKERLNLKLAGMEYEAAQVKSQVTEQSLNSQLAVNKLEQFINKAAQKEGFKSAAPQASPVSSTTVSASFGPQTGQGLSASAQSSAPVDTQAPQNSARRDNSYASRADNGYASRADNLPTPEQASKWSNFIGGAKTVDEANKKYAPDVTSIDGLNAKYKPEAGSLDELNKKYDPNAVQVVKPSSEFEQALASIGSDFKPAAQGITEVAKATAAQTVVLQGTAKAQLEVNTTITSELQRANRFLGRIATATESTASQARRST